MFKELCGRHSFKNIVLVTTMWDSVLEDVGIQHEQELQQDWWHSMIRLGSTIYRFHLTEESAWEIIKRFSEPQPGGCPLQIQREIVDERKPLHKTSTGRAIIRSITDIFLGVKGFFSKGPKGSKNSQDKAPLPSQRHHLLRSPSSSSVSSLSSHSSGVTTDESVCTDASTDASTGASIDISAGTLSEHGYKTALESAILSLKLAQSSTELVRIRCLKDAIVPSLSIAQAIEVIFPVYFGRR